MNLLNADTNTLLPMTRTMQGVPEATRLKNLQNDGVNTSLRNGNLKSSMEEYRQVAQDFESVFLSEMLKPMWEGVEANEMFGGGQAEEIFHSMLIDEYAGQIAKNRGIGIADAVMNELIKMNAINVNEE